MRWRRRVCRTAKWLSGTAAALLVAAWLASMVGWFQWAPTSGRVGTSSSYLICNSRGSLVLDWLRPYKHSTDMVWIPHDMGGGLRFGGYIETKPLQSEWRWRPRLIRKEGFRRALLIVPI